jgi:hypothetical protein
MILPVLAACAVFTAAIVIGFVWYMLKSESFGDLHPNRLNLTVLVLFFFAIAAVMSFMLFSALAHGDAYGIGSHDTGKVYPVSQEPVLYWFLVVIYYSAAVAALSLGLVVAAKLIQPRRLLSEPDNAADPKSELGESPYQPFERLSQCAAVVYIAGVLIAFYVYWSHDWELPSRNRVAAVLFAPVFLFFGLLALYTGEVGLKIRAETPLAYWARVVAMLVLGGGMLLIGIGVVGA